ELSNHGCQQLEVAQAAFAKCRTIDLWMHMDDVGPYSNMHTCREIEPGTCSKNAQMFVRQLCHPNLFTDGTPNPDPITKDSQANRLIEKFSGLVRHAKTAVSKRSSDIFRRCALIG